MRITDFEMIHEIKEEYVSLRRLQNNRAATVDKLIEEYQSELTIGAEDDGLLFWVGLADAQYACKELTEEIAGKAMEAIDLLGQSDMEICADDLLRRKQNYTKAPMPERKMRKARAKFRCSWKVGDTFAYQITGEEATSLGIAGSYALFRKVSEVERFDGSIVPVVTITIWKESPLPIVAKDFAAVLPLKLVSGRLNTPVGKYEYRTEFIINSKKDLCNAPLIYLGNFQDVDMPCDEHIIMGSGYILMTRLERIQEYLCRYWKRNCQYIGTETWDKGTVRRTGDGSVS